MTGAGYEWSPFGAVPIGTTNVENLTPEQASKIVVRADYGNDAPPLALTPEAAQLPPPPPRQLQPKARKDDPVTTPKQVIADAKARVKQIKADLRHMKALQVELAELERLLAAAKGKPKSYIRPVRNAG